MLKPSDIQPVGSHSLYTSLRVTCQILTNALVCTLVSSSETWYYPSDYKSLHPLCRKGNGKIHQPSKRRKDSVREKRKTERLCVCVCVHVGTPVCTHACKINLVQPIINDRHSSKIKFAGIVFIYMKRLQIQNNFLTLNFLPQFLLLHPGFSSPFFAIFSQFFLHFF